MLINLKELYLTAYKIIIDGSYHKYNLKLSNVEYDCLKIINNLEYINLLSVQCKHDSYH